jgi:NAD(P)H-dependent flavin oxidoreductase YrpB (nitropropane dioxygenase family)
MKSLTRLRLSGKEDVLPLVEGGKGISASNGQSAGAWAATGGVGTFSAVNADTYDDNGHYIPYVYKGRTRRERHNELVEMSIKGAITQAKIAHEVSNGQGRLHMNVLWEMGAVEPILLGTLKEIAPLIHGVTCGAGMPFRLAEICANYGISYYPIVSSARAFMILWKRAYRKFPENLSAVVYEDPWLAGGHNGITNNEDPFKPEPPMPRVIELRRVMNSFCLNHIPIVMAGGVWHLNEWQDWLDNPDIGPIAFQFGTRPLLTKESPIPDIWKKKLLTLKEGQIRNNYFSPTGFYSSAVHNSFLENLRKRSERQIPYTRSAYGEHTESLPVGIRKRVVYVTAKDKLRAWEWIDQGFTTTMKTPDSTLVFVTPEEEQTILTDQINCMGCLSVCKFSNWAQNEEGTTGKKGDPRSFCIQKTLQNIAHGHDPDQELMFAGHQAYRFATDPFYADDFVPTVQQLIDRLQEGL